MQEQSFTGKVTNKLDAKGRVSIPSGFRQVLAAQGTDGVYFIPALGDKCGKGFGERFHAESREILKPHHPLFDPRHATLASAVFAESIHASFDDDGRVRLPDSIIEYCGIKDRVLFTGADSVFDVWHPEAYEAIIGQRREQALALYRETGKSLP